MVSAYCLASWLCPLENIQRTVDHNSPETLLAGIAALAAKVVIGGTVVLAEEERPFFLALLAHSQHGGPFLPVSSV